MSADLATITLTPFLVVNGAARAIEFYRAAFGAAERYRLVDKAGTVVHAEITIGGALVMLGEEHPQFGILGPDRPGGAGSGLQLQVPDVDGFVARAAAAGATVVRPPTDEFYGDRSARLHDPFGHVWQIATTIETVTPEEMQRRMDRL